MLWLPPRWRIGLRHRGPSGTTADDPEPGTEPGTDPYRHCGTPDPGCTHDLNRGVLIAELTSQDGPYKDTRALFGLAWALAAQST